MNEINNKQEMRDYIMDTMKKDSKSIEINNEIGGMPFVAIENPKDVKIQGKMFKKGDKFVLYADGTLELLNTEKAKDMQKTEYTRQDARKADSPRFAVAVLSGKSPNLNTLEYEMKKNQIEFATANFKNERTEDEFVRFTFNKKHTSIVGEINKAIKDFGKKLTDRPQPELDTDKYKLVSTRYERIDKSDDKYIQEQMHVPEQTRDSAKALLEQINDSIRKCETYLGEMKEAQLTSNKKVYDKAKGDLNREYAKLKELQYKAIEENQKEHMYDKAIAIKAIDSLGQDIKEATMFDKEGPDKLKTKLKGLPTSYFIIHLNDMLSIKENLSKQEQMDVMSALDGTTSQGYSQQTKNARNYGIGKEENDTVLSDVKSDGDYHIDYGEAGTANGSQHEEKLAEKQEKSFMDNINATIEEEYEEDERYTTRTLF